MSTLLNAQLTRWEARLSGAFVLTSLPPMDAQQKASREALVVEQICNAYSDGLAAGLRSDHAQPHQGIEELDRAYALGVRDGVIMRECKQRLDAGVRAYQ
jgi:hypothetical protein